MNMAAHYKKPLPFIYTFSYIGVITAGAASRFLAPAPVHGAVGVGALTPLQGSGYEHPATGT
jgi:hypothetical protein